jgi:hypothetical protein
MRRTLPLLLSLLLAVPFSARAQGDEADDEETKSKKKSKGDSAEPKGEMQFNDLQLTPKRKKKGNEKPGTEKGTVEASEKDTRKDATTDRPEISGKPDEKPAAGFARHRYGYVIGGGFLVAGLAFAYSAQGEAKRAETIGTAREASQALENARASAATANVIYGAAAATLAVALLFEILPEPVAEKASLTFHF